MEDWLRKTAYEVWSDTGYVLEIKYGPGSVGGQWAANFQHGSHAAWAERDDIKAAVIAAAQRLLESFHTRSFSFLNDTEKD